MKDYYKVLQIDRRAEPEVIEVAYRRLARKYQPDVDDSPEAAQRVKELDEAYEVLSDPAKRAEYDHQRTPRAGATGSGASSAHRRTRRAPQRPTAIAQAVLDRAQQIVAPRLTTTITTRQALLIGLFVLAIFTRFWRLGTPDLFYFDEVFFAKTGQEILHGDSAAWEWFGHENTHPPLSKLFMAGGMAFFGDDSAFGWRFFGALAGVGSVAFIYLLGKRLFKSEIVGMVAAFLMVFEGLFFVQSRLATPDTYLVFFILGSIYFLVSDRPLLSGIFFGAAMATKWTAVLTLFPIGLYLTYRLLQTERSQWRQYLGEASLAVPLFFFVVPVSIYLLTYVPMLFSGYSLGDAWDLNHLAFDFHRDRELTHPYSSPWDTWPIMMRPVFLYLSDSGAKIYSLGNPVIFWLGLPALGVVLWQGVRGVGARLDEVTGRFSLSGSVNPEQAAMLFVVLAYLGFWLPWAIQPRIMFIYHYLPALPFLLLALAYVIHRLWQWSWGRAGAVLFLAAAVLTFAYFYPHLAAIDISDAWADSLFWFSSWR